MNFWEVIGKSEYVFEMLLFSFVLGRHFVRKRHFLVRAGAGIFLCFLGSFLTCLYARSMWGSIPGIAVIFLLVMLTCLFCFENPIEEIFFVNTTAYIAQIILYSVFIIFDTLLGPHEKAVTAILYVLLLLGAVWLLDSFPGRKLRRLDGTVLHPAVLLFLLFSAGLIDTVFKFYMIEHRLGKEAGGIFAAWKLFSMGSCILIMMIQFSLLQKNSVSLQNQKLEELLYQKQQQYEIFKENMDLLNIKCHDLKHWLQKLDGQIYEEEADEIQKALTIYDSMLNTGNETLDVVLTEKRMYCEYNGITLVCSISQGELLNFLTKGEICSLFGNILDNGIEAVSKVPEEDKRIIHLLVKNRGNFLSIHEENYYAGELKQNRKEFETTKEDSRYHGFGLKSVRMIVEKHGGNVSIQAENGVFNMNILFPLGSNGKNMSDK